MVIGGTVSEISGGSFANGAIAAAFSAAVEWNYNDEIFVTGEKNIDRKELASLKATAVTPVFYDASGNPLSEHATLAEALQAGETASRAEAAASGTNNEYGVATITGRVTAGGIESYYNSRPLTSNNPHAIAWDTAGLKGTLVAVNHLHPGNNAGFSPEDRDTYTTIMKRGYGEFRGVYMFDGIGNHWYGPVREWRWWIFHGTTQNHSCGGSSATAWTCPSF